MVLEKRAGLFGVIVSQQANFKSTTTFLVITTQPHRYYLFEASFRPVKRTNTREYAAKHCLA